MRIPHPAALLVDHPALPRPEIAGAVREDSERPPATTSVGSLSRRERYGAAVQLTAAVALLSEFDLWLPRSAFEGLHLLRSGDGIRPVLGRYPIPLSRVVDCLGGGEAAMEAMRSAAIDRIVDILRLSSSETLAEHPDPGICYEDFIGHLLRELPQPLDRQTARSLWALRWNPLPLPEDGLVELWAAPLQKTARQLAAALWSDLRRRGRRAWVWPAEESGLEPESIPAVSGDGTMIIVGQLSNHELNALSRWASGNGRSAVGIGLFPRGWHADPPSLGRGSLTGHLAVAGLPLESARRLIEARQDRFDPFESSDRAALTESLQSVLRPRRPVPGVAAAATRAGALKSWLALSPRGLPPGFISLHSGLSPAALESQRQATALVEVGPRWRLPEPVPLGRDPRHLRVAELYAPGQPSHLLHTALGSGDTEMLELWARSSLDRLDAASVRELLATIESGALGERVQMLLAEACLAVLDLSGARSALAAVPAKNRGAVELWCAALDPEPGAGRRLPTDTDLAAHPRAAAETAALVLDETSRHLRSSTSMAAVMIEAGRRRSGGELQRWFEIEQAFRLAPERLGDQRWRRGITAGHPELRARAAHRSALWNLECGRVRQARRLLEVLSRDAVGPGQRGAIELDLGAVALSQGRSRDAEGHHLRAYHLLRTAGFRHRTSLPLFNLAVADVDQLRVQRAAERLESLAALDPREPFVIGEQARLALAVGDEPVFRRRLEIFEGRVDEGDPRFAEGLALLHGVRKLLDGDSRRAARDLARAGQEGVAWGALAAAVAGEEQEDVGPDLWGVARAAALVRHDGPDEKAAITHDLDPARLTDALALALAERVKAEKFSVADELRSLLIAALRRSGLEGWAESLAGLRERAGGVVSALARVVETGGLETVERHYLEKLQASLGVSGLEIRDAIDGTLIWSQGGGAPGSEMRHGRLAVVPLGGSLDDGPTSRLVVGVLDLVLPRHRAADDRGAEATGFFGISEAARNVRRELRELAPTHLPVLLVGETGVGKEVAARALHTLSRRKGAFVAVNVSAIPETLLEAELFGSVKGAFTGADRSRRGLAVAADGGTLFLDEIGDLEGQLQVKLLRFIETREVRPVGSHVTRGVDVRIVSATHRDLGRRMREGTFRRDLYFRIAAPEVQIPPLRSRAEDIPLLREIFEREAHGQHGLPRPVWSAESEALLRSYYWPGNVRELRQVVEVAMVRAQGAAVRAEHLPIGDQDTSASGTWDDAQREFRRRFLSAALRRNGGNRSAAARQLGISRQALLYHLRNLGLQNLDQD